MFDRLKREMRKQGMSQAALSRAAGINNSNLNQAIKNRQSLFPAWRVRISEVLGVPEEELFESKYHTFVETTNIGQKVLSVIENSTFLLISTDGIIEIENVEDLIKWSKGESITKPKRWDHGCAAVDIDKIPVKE